MLYLILDSIALVVLIKLLAGVLAANTTADMRRGTDFVRGLGVRGWFAVVVLWLAVAVPSALQRLHPELYHKLRVQPSTIRHEHQYWRLLTSTAVQDSVGAMIFNLVLLALVAVLCAQCWGSLRTIVLFVVFAVGLNAVAAFYDQTTAGNSGATFALGASVAGWAIVRGRPKSLRWSGLGITVLGALMFFIDDYHGEAIVAGAAVGFVLGVLGVELRGPARTRRGSRAEPTGRPGEPTGRRSARTGG